MREFHATNQPGTCLWCGHKLVNQGYFKTGHFCTMRCGFMFADRMAELGKRFDAQDTPPPVHRTRYIYPPCPECGQPMLECTGFDIYFACKHCQDGEYYYDFDKSEQTRDTPSGTVTTVRYTLSKETA